MARLTVKNVGPIREADFEVKKYTVFIGPQGSGKSTLAKLISMLSSRKTAAQNAHIEHNIQLYLSTHSSATFLSHTYKGQLKNEQFNYTIAEKETSSSTTDHDSYTYQHFDFEDIKTDIKDLVLQIRDTNHFANLDPKRKLEIVQKLLSYGYSTFTAWSEAGELEEVYIPSERMLIALLSKSLWGLINSDVSFPKVVLTFASSFEKAKNEIPAMALPFLKVAYQHIDGDDLLTYESGSLSLSQSASGFQSIIPLLLVVEHQRQTAPRRFIIEEPELNLYPTAQKDLIYNLVSGLDLEKTYQDAEWVFTTHSPYVLSSLNTLMLAYKVGHQSEENRAKVEAIIPARHWINPDDFAAYYVDEGTVRSIINPKTGLISDNELDDVSEDLAGEQDQLLELYRSFLHA